MARPNGGERYVVSACLAGARSRFDGTSKRSARVERLVRDGEAIPVCPEQLGGLPTPRPATEIAGGGGAAVLADRARVLTANGSDLTANFLRGAEEAAALAELFGATSAILKSRSPSCGCGAVYDGSFKDRVVDGDGVLTALLRRKGLKVMTEEEFEKIG